MKHYSLFPFPLNVEKSGGLPSVFLNEVKATKELILFTPGEKDYEINNAKIFHASIDKIDISSLSLFWFGNGCILKHIQILKEIHIQID